MALLTILEIMIIIGLFFSLFLDVEQFQNLGYRPVIAKDDSTCFIQATRNHMVSNVLVSRYAQKALTGIIITIIIM